MNMKCACSQEGGGGNEFQNVHNSVYVHGSVGGGNENHFYRTSADFQKYCYKPQPLYVRTYVLSLPMSTGHVQCPYGHDARIENVQRVCTKVCDFGPYGHFNTFWNVLMT